MPRPQWFHLLAMRSAILVILGVLIALASGCAPAPASPSAENSITVAAAADLQSAFTDISTAFEQQTGAKVVFSFGSSGNLEVQIENGAPIDVFASADEDYVQRLVAKGLAAQGDVKLYGLGRLALVSYKAGGLQIQRPQDLLNPEVKHISIANPDHAPYGVAARQALTAAGIWDQVKPKVVYGENVRQALQFVQTGNAEAGMVALSIANVPEVNYVKVDESLYQPLRQAIVVLKGAHEAKLASEFVAFINGPKGRPIMDKYGYTLPEGK